MRDRREYNHQYYVTNREKRLEYSRRWQKAHPKKYKEYLRQYRKKNREKIREYQRQWQLANRAKLRTQVLDLLGGKCVRCGLSEAQLLQIDHINGGGNAEYKALKSHTRLLQKVLADPTGYQLLCPTCNWRKRIEHGEYNQARVML